MFELCLQATYLVIKMVQGAIELFSCSGIEWLGFSKEESQVLLALYR